MHKRAAYSLGVQASLEKLGVAQKLGGTRVAVSNEQTPQAESYSATDSSTQEHSIDSIWGQHDKRQQLFNVSKFGN